MKRMNMKYKEGMKFGEWELLKYISSGGNGSVWEVKKNGIKEVCAIKLLKSVNKKTLARFKSEINIVKENNLVYGILPILDSYLSEKNNETSWYVMPLASSINQYIEKMNEEEVIYVIIKIGEVLMALHEKEIVHRDIKPGNLLFYNDNYYLADFGLVDYPDKEDLTTRFESVGPKWTIAPEMRRNPITADGKKADVYSLAKTMWILLTGESLGFDGQYSVSGKNFLGKHNPDLFSDPLDILLSESTSDDPNERPSMREFVEKLNEWQEQNKSYKKRNPYEWKMVQERLFPKSIPSRVVWENLDDIIGILNLVGSIPSLNHMFYPGGGGMDLYKATLAQEADCLELHAGLIDVVKPKRLLFESIGKDTQWNYFRLEIERLDPIVADYEFGYEQLNVSQSGYEKYSDDSSEKTVTRYNREGALVIFQKTSFYNQLNSTYDGRHSKMDTNNFKEYIRRMEKHYSEQNG